MEVTNYILTIIDADLMPIREYLSMHYEYSQLHHYQKGSAFLGLHNPQVAPFKSL